jgi:hypothetical protein
LNIFAYELANVLEQRGHLPTVLYTLRTPEGLPLLPPAKVARLLRSLTDEVTAVLNDRELGLVVGVLGLTPQEARRLRAAQLGEAVRKLLLGRVATMSALEEGERVVALVVAEEEEAGAVREELSDVPQGTGLLQPRPTADTNAAVSFALEVAAEACEQGELWLSVALQATDPDQRDDLLQVAWQALDRAAQYLACAPAVAQGSSHQEEWRRTVEVALDTIRLIRARSR